MTKHKKVKPLYYLLPILAVCLAIFVWTLATASPSNKLAAVLQVSKPINSSSSSSSSSKPPVSSSSSSVSSCGYDEMPCGGASCCSEGETCQQDSLGNYFCSLVVVPEKPQRPTTPTYLNSDCQKVGAECGVISIAGGFNLLDCGDCNNPNFPVCDKNKCVGCDSTGGKQIYCDSGEICGACPSKEICYSSSYYPQCKTIAQICTLTGSDCGDIVIRDGYNDTEITINCGECVGKVCKYHYYEGGKIYGKCENPCIKKECGVYTDDLGNDIVCQPYGKNCPKDRPVCDDGTCIKKSSSSSSSSSSPALTTTNQTTLQDIQTKLNSLYAQLKQLLGK